MSILLKTEKSFRVNFYGCNLHSKSDANHFSRFASALLFQPQKRIYFFAPNAIEKYPENSAKMEKT